MAGPPIFVITGQLAAGKSTVAGALLAQFPHGFHIDVDGVREMVVSGYASPLDRSEEADRQFRVAEEASARLAEVYHDAGFTVAIEGTIDPRHMQAALTELGLWDGTTAVELYPPLEVALERNRARTHKGFDTEILEEAIHGIDAQLRGEPPPEGWLRIDNGGEPVAVTVGRILAAAGGP